MICEDEFFKDLKYYDMVVVNHCSLVHLFLHLFDILIVLHDFNC